MVQDVRSSATGGVAFDLLSQEGVMRALQYVRTSAGSPLEKRELRDLIFSYTNTGGDPALRTLIEQRLVALPVAAAPERIVPAMESNIPVKVNPITTEIATTSSLVQDIVVSVPSVVQTPLTVVPVAAAVSQAVIHPIGRSGFGGGRPAPHFGTVVSVAVPVVPAAPITPVNVPPRVSPVTSSPVTSQQIPTLPPFPTPSVPEPVAPAVESFADILSQPIVEVVEPVQATKPAPVIQPVVVPQPIPVPEPVVVMPTAALVPPTAPIAAPLAEVVSQSVSPEVMVERYRNRIAEIKQSVNSRVGNPVNLINMNREVGSTYMTNLLSAMKAVSGASGDPVATMRALEESYKQVGLLLTPATIEPVAIPEVVSVEVPNPTLSTSGYDAIIPIMPAPSIDNVPRISALEIQRRDLGGIPAHTPTLPQSIRPVTPAVETAPVTHDVIQPSGMVSPVASAVPLKTPQDLPTAAQKKAELGITDPLLDPDVDTGLDQLLSEWTIFKKSGMFGTGPRGRQHPLFDKLGPINMVLIVSGRFEGATSEIRQSITDYMNGWRYEQGITYENDENFEHYLRRVVRHILDLQYNRRTS